MHAEQWMEQLKRGAAPKVDIKVFRAARRPSLYVRLLRGQHLRKIIITTQLFVFFLVKKMGYQQTALLMQAIVVSSLLASALAIAGQYVPRSYYVIDKFGHQSDFVYLRTRRALDLHPFVMRSKRGGGSYSSSSASSSSSAGSGAPIYFGDNLPNRAYSNVESNASGNGGYPGGSRSFASSSSSSSAGGGIGGHPGGSYGNSNNNNDGPQLFSRFGEAEGTGIKVGASAAGPKAAFSSSSSSIDSDGKIKYSIQSGKI